MTVVHYMLNGFEKMVRFHTLRAAASFATRLCSYGHTVVVERVR